MLDVRRLTKRFSRIAAVDNVSFTIRPGEILGYLGPNGSGKSTTVKMLTGLLRPSEGEVFYRGKNVMDEPTAFRRHIGYVPEEPFLYTHLSGREYLQLVGRLRGMARDDLNRKIDSLLYIFGLVDDRYSLLSSYFFFCVIRICEDTSVIDSIERVFLSLSIYRPSEHQICTC